MGWVSSTHATPLPKVDLRNLLDITQVADLLLDVDFSACAMVNCRYRVAMAPSSISIGESRFIRCSVVTVFAHHW